MEIAQSIIELIKAICVLVIPAIIPLIYKLLLSHRKAAYRADLIQCVSRYVQKDSPCQELEFIIEKIYAKCLQYKVNSYCKETYDSFRDSKEKKYKDLKV